MNKNKVLSYLFVFLGLVVIVGSAYFIASYSSGTLRSVVDFITTNDYTKLRQCGVTTPPQFDRVREDLTTLILPFLYAGLPLLFLLTSFFMFVAGTYYNRACTEEESEKRKQIRDELVSKLTARKEKEVEKETPVVKSTVVKVHETPLQSP